MKLDGHLTCYRCGASAHDAVDEGMGEVLAECCFCGALEWCKSPLKQNEPLAEPPGEFRFKFGRFTGMTLTEAAAQPNGRKYLEWMAANNERLRGRIAEYLETTRAAA